MALVYSVIMKHYSNIDKLFYSIFKAKQHNNHQPKNNSYSYGLAIYIVFIYKQSL